MKPNTLVLGKATLTCYFVDFSRPLRRDVDKSMGTTSKTGNNGVM